MRSRLLCEPVERPPNKRLKPPGGDCSKGSGVFAPWRARTVVQRPCAGGRVARRLSAIRQAAHLKALLSAWHWLKAQFYWRRPHEWKRQARALGLQPVYADWVGFFGLDDAGNPWFAEHASWRDRKPVAEPELRHVVRAVASRRYFHLRGLRPVRTATAVTCPTCKGTGRPPLPPPHWQMIRYRCAGAGWVEPEWIKADQPS